MRADGPEALLEIANQDPGMTGHLPGTHQAPFERGHARLGLMWVLRGNQPPHLVQAQFGDGPDADPAMTCMGWIERTAEEADAQPSPPG